MYIIKKDGLYLAGYQDTGIRETDAKGNYRSFLTGVYSSDKRDAILVENYSLAELLGAVAVRVSENAKGGKKK